MSAPAAAGAVESTLHVDQAHPSCSATAAGTADEPFCTIGAAAAKAGPGTTVEVAKGIYRELVKPPSGAPGSPVTFSAAPGATVVGTGGLRPAFLVERASWVTIRGFTVKDAVDGFLVSDSSNIAVIANRVSGTTDGIQLNYTTDSRVEGNTVDHASTGIYLATGGLSGRSSRNRIAGNAVSFNFDAGIHLNGADANNVVANVIRGNGTGIKIQYSADNVLANNVAFDNLNSGINILWTGGTRILSNSLARNVAGTTPLPEINFFGSPGSTLANNVIDVGNGEAAVRIPSNSIAGTSLDYDVVNAPAGNKLIQWNGWSYPSLAKFIAATGQEARGIQADPRFAAPAEGNLALTAGSPAVDSARSGLIATPAGPLALPTTDVFGGARVDDAATANSGAGPRDYDDRGAYELRNAGFEADTAGWNSTGSGVGVTLARAGAGHTGAGAAVLSNGGSGSATCALNDSPNWVKTTAAGTYTATLWVRAETAGATLKLRLREWSGAVEVGEAKHAVTLTADWQPVQVQYTAGSPGSSTLDLSAYVTGAAPGTCFHADDASISIG